MPTKHIALGLLIAFAACAAAPLAFAQAATGGGLFNFDPAPWIDQVFEFGALALGGWVTFAFRHLPPAVIKWLDQQHANAFLQAVLSRARQGVKDAGWDKPVSIDVGSEWLAAAMRILEVEGREFLAKWGREKVEDMLLGRIPLPQSVAVQRAVMPATADQRLAGYVDPHRAAS